MRKDIYERMKLMKKDGIKPNYAEVARTYDCDYRTVKRYFERDSATFEKREYPSKLDPYRQIIQDKLNIGCSAHSIFKFIEKKGFTGKYTLVKDYCRKIKQEESGKLLIMYQKNLITSFGLSSKSFNYKIEHMKEILSSEVMKYKDEGEIKEFAKKQLKLYDNLNGD